VKEKIMNMGLLPVSNRLSGKIEEKKLKEVVGKQIIL
jgi:hypothetical protein